MRFEMEYWPIDRLREYGNNPRVHDIDMVEKIAAAIQEFGFRVPVVAKSDGTLVDGHLRLKAARFLGLKEVPVLLADDMTDLQIKAFRLAVNRMAELAEWDLDLLAQEIQQLDLDGFDLEVLGFDDKYLADLLDGNVSGGVTEDEAAADMPSLPSGDREPFQQKTFTLHDEQAAIVDDAITLARTSPVVDTGLNENSNGNALTLICREWLEMKNGDR